MILMSGQSRGVSLAPANSESSGDLLTLNSANSSNPAYQYWSPEENYLGAFVPDDDPGGTGDMHDSMGPIAFNNSTGTMFVAGHYTQHTVAEFNVPVLVTATNSANLGDLNVGSTVQVLQGFASAGTGADASGVIAGLYVDDGNRLLITTFEHYAQNGDYKSVFRVVRNAGSMSSSTVDGYFDTVHDAAAGGWTAEVPVDLQSALGGTHISGFSNSGALRSSTQSLSMGPAAYAGNIGYLMANSASLSASYLSGANAQAELIRYHLDPTGLVPESDLYNWDDDTETILSSNPMWTACSDISHGEIVPGTRTYAVFGVQSMVDSGGWYGTNDTRPSGVPIDSQFEAQGPHPRDPDDWHWYYWLYDVNDMAAVLAGTVPDSWADRYQSVYGSPRALEAYEILPYEWGKLWMPFDKPGEKHIGGGTRDKASGILYLSQWRWDNSNGYDTPVICGFSLGW